MQDTYVETEVLTQPLRFAMVATRAAAVLKGIEEGKQLNQKERQALQNAVDLVHRATKGASVIRDKNMMDYSADAMSAFHLVRKTGVPGSDKNPKPVISFLERVASALKSLIKHPERKTKFSKKKLQEFFTELASRSLSESTTPSEEVIQIG